MKKFLSITMALIFIFGVTMAIKPASKQADAATSGMELQNVISE